jgi:hypothetical protein
MYAILNCNSIYGIFGDLVAKLGTPFMDKRERYTWSNSLKNLTVSTNVRDVLDYLFTYREEIQNKRILRIDCYTIMEYSLVGNSISLYNGVSLVVELRRRVLEAVAHSSIPSAGMKLSLITSIL